MQEALITPSLLEWARKRSDLSTEDLAARANLNPTRIVDWESGRRRPTLRQATTLATQLRIPLGYLFLKAPPQLELPLPDLRTVARAVERTVISSSLREAIYDAKLKQEWYREYLLNEGADPLTFVGSFNTESAPAVIAGSIKDILNLGELGNTKRGASKSAYRSDLTRRAERAGVSVLRSSIVRSNTGRKLSVDEFRGFAIVDDMAPLIFINGSDSDAAQIFTLIHELTHIWIGTPGISDSTHTSADKLSRIEKLCNEVAAEVVVPVDEFSAKWSQGTPFDLQVRQLSNYFCVSELVVLRAARDSGFITSGQFYSYFDQIKDRTRSNQSSGGNFYYSLKNRNGEQISLAMISEVVSGKMSYREAANLLNVKANTISKAAEEYAI